jgi:hypothetical protein
MTVPTGFDVSKLRVSNDSQYIMSAVETLMRNRIFPIAGWLGKVLPDQIIKEAGCHEQLSPPLEFESVEVLETLRKKRQRE